MYIEIDEEIELKHFAVGEFYDVETCFCWNDKENKLVIFPYTQDRPISGEVRILPTPLPLKKIHFFGSRAFFVFEPRGVYKLSQDGKWAVLSKNALASGAEFFRALVAKADGIHVVDKDAKSSTLLFSTTSDSLELICTLPLILKDTEAEFVNCLKAEWEAENNLCVVAYDRKLFLLRNDTLQLIHTTDETIVNILPVRRKDKIAGLLLLVETITDGYLMLVHGKDCNLIFEKIHLERDTKNIVTFCACFSAQIDNILWIVYCDRSKTYYVKKELFTNVIQEVKVENKVFVCLQQYKSNIVIGLSPQRELLELSVETLDNCATMSNTNITLCSNMFQKTDLIVKNIYERVKELNILNESFADKQDKLKRINFYASKQKFQVITSMEVSKLCNYHYLTLSIPDRIPKNSYAVFSFVYNENQNIFCMKKVTETAVTIKIPINKNGITHSSSIKIDLITLIDEQQPWCLIQNLINSPPQDIKRKRGPKKDKTAFINAKIASLKTLITEKKDLNITKLREIKKIIRAEL